MKALRSIAVYLFDMESVTFNNSYNSSKTVYYKEEIEKIRLYYKFEDKGYKSQYISLAKPARDKNGFLIKSKTKTLNAFVANYVHFLDANICHYVIEKFSEKGLPIGTIHDSFFVKPDNPMIPDKFQFIRQAYCSGLITVGATHKVNLMIWLLKICNWYKDNNLDYYERYNIGQRFIDIKNKLIKENTIQTLPNSEDWSVIFEKGFSANKHK